MLKKLRIHTAASLPTAWAQPSIGRAIIYMSVSLSSLSHPIRLPPSNMPHLLMGARAVGIRDGVGDGTVFLPSLSSWHTVALRPHAPLSLCLSASVSASVSGP